MTPAGTVTWNPTEGPLREPAISQRQPLQRDVPGWLSDRGGPGEGPGICSGFPQRRCGKAVVFFGIYIYIHTHIAISNFHSYLLIHYSIICLTNVDFLDRGVCLAQGHRAKNTEQAMNHQKSWTFHEFRICLLYLTRRSLTTSCTCT